MAYLNKEEWVFSPSPLGPHICSSGLLSLVAQFKFNKEGGEILLKILSCTDIC